MGLPDVCFFFPGNHEHIFNGTKDGANSFFILRRHTSWLSPLLISCLAGIWFLSSLSCLVERKDVPPSLRKKKRNHGIDPLLGLKKSRTWGQTPIDSSFFLRVLC